MTGPSYRFADKAETAAWLGCTIAQMDAEHDRLHRSLMTWLGTHSRSMREAKGEELHPVEQRIAWDEEAAILALQKLIWSLRNSGQEIEV